MPGGLPVETDLPDQPAGIVLTPAARAEHYRQQDLWGEQTLVQLFRETAAAHPDRLAVVDPAALSDPQQLTYRQLARRTDQVADFLGGLRLEPGSVVACQMRASVDTLILYFACWQCGLIVAPLPPYWRHAELRRALEPIKPVILATSKLLPNDTTAERLRDVAAEMISVRYAFGFGPDLPDGYFNLSDLYDEEVESDKADARLAADQITSLNWGQLQPAKGSAGAIPRSHNHWLAAGRHIVDQIALPPAPTLLSPFDFSGLSGIGAGLLPWLLSSGVLHLHAYENVQSLSRHAGLIGADYLVVPGELATEVAAPFDSASVDHRPVILAAWKQGVPASVKVPNFLKIYDLNLFDELGFLLQERSAHDANNALPLQTGVGANTMNGRSINLTVKAQVRRNRLGDCASSLLSGALRLSGAMVPDVMWPDELQDGDVFTARVGADGVVVTDILVDVQDGDPPTGVIAGRLSESLLRTGVPLMASELDDLYSDIPGVQSGAAFLADGPGGKKLLAAALVASDPEETSIERITDYLAASAISPLKIPTRIVLVDEIPRDVNGHVLRDGLALTG